ncbi:MAG: hypothetical protein ACKVT0_04890, partial [Planctomycetaceae bacterium]
MEDDDTVSQEFLDLIPHGVIGIPVHPAEAGDLTVTITIDIVAEDGSLVWISAVSGVGKPARKCRTLDTGGRDVKVGINPSLDQFQAQPKRKMSGYSTATQLFWLFRYFNGSSPKSAEIAPSDSPAKAGVSP